MMWSDLLAAIALCIVMEGLVPFINPGGLKRTCKRMAEMDDRTLRIAGLVSMLLGLACLYLVRSGALE